jgi:4-oxalocrotonate tautomerase
VTLIQVKLLEGVFTAPQKQEIIERLTDAMVEIQGENMRRTVWCVIDEVANGEWGIGGQAITSGDAKALARARPHPDAGSMNTE